MRHARVHAVLPFLLAGIAGIVACERGGAEQAAASAAPAPATKAPPAKAAPASTEAKTPASPAAAAPGKPLETRPPEAAGQTPERPDQTRAPGVTSDVAFDVIVLAKGLAHPWAVEPLPDGALLVTEKPGRMRIVSASGEVGEPIAGVPAVDDRGQGGLLDVALSPTFADDRLVYWSYAEPRDGGNGTAVARGTLSEDRARLEGVAVILRAQPTYAGRLHYGSRLAFGPDGMLHVTLGERSDVEMRPQAQRLDSHMGKLLRVRPDGTAPDDNPFVGQAGALPEIWVLGQRNVQSAAFDASGQLWTVDHGPQGGDELNRIVRGLNYGWPLVTYGEEYSGAPVPNAVTSKPGYESPVYYWDPVIAPSGAQFHSGTNAPGWRGSLFVGALRSARLVRLVIEGGRVTGEEHLLADRRQRVRDVREGAGGVLYVVTDEADGELWKVVPRP